MNFLVLDVETNGLLGLPFAVGAILMDSDTGAILNSFSGKSPYAGQATDFVLTRVLPACKDLVMYDSSAYLRHAFWRWYKSLGQITVFADVMHPVESHFIYLCQVEHGEEWGGPYPMHEVATLLMAVGVDPDVKRLDYTADLRPQDREFFEHNPLHDATVSAYAVLKALRSIKQAAI